MNPFGLANHKKCVLYPLVGLQQVFRATVGGNAGYGHEQHRQTVAEENFFSDVQFQVVSPVCSSAKSASVLSSISKSFVDPFMWGDDVTAACPSADKSVEPIQRICSTLSICSPSSRPSLRSKITRPRSPFGTASMPSKRLRSITGRISPCTLMTPENTAGAPGTGVTRTGGNTSATAGSPIA